MRGLNAFCRLLRILIPCFVLRKHKDLQVGHAQSSGLRPGCA
jgi:hypothetical protein